MSSPALWWSSVLMVSATRNHCTALSTQERLTYWALMVCIYIEETEPSLIQVMACYLLVPIHYLKQYWLCSTWLLGWISIKLLSYVCYCFLGFSLYPGFTLYPPRYQLQIMSRMMLSTGHFWFVLWLSAMDVDHNHRLICASVTWMI